MQTSAHPFTKTSFISYLALALWLVMLAWRLTMPKPDLYAKGASAWVEITFLLILYGYINITAGTLGWMFLRRMALPLLKTESLLAAYLLGLGAVSMGVMVVGLLGWLTSPVIFIGLALIGLLTCHEWSVVVKDGWEILRSFRLARLNKPFELLLQIIIIISLATALINALLPVWDYDALLYHLELPRQFLAQGKIYFDPEVLRSAYPFLGEMLFMVGLVFHLASLSKLINLTYAILFILSIYVFSKRFFGRENAILAAAIWVGTPALLFWATWASIDFAWAGYEFWSVYFFMLWRSDEKNNTSKWLALAGVMSGLAASTKYLSIMSLGLVFLLIAWQSIRNTKPNFRVAIQNLLIFGCCAGAVMGAWYIKNLIVTGNPIYPLVFGGPGWTPIKNAVLNDYVYSFGVGKSWLDYLLLPYNVYASHNQFSTIYVELIHPALWLAFFYPFLPRTKKYLPLIAYAGLYCASWAVGSQVIRFLIPPSAFLAMFAASTIERLPNFFRVCMKTLIVSVMFAALIYHLAILDQKSVLAYFTGQKSAADVIASSAEDFLTIQHIEKTFQPGERAQLLWDGRGFYCETHCSPDDEQSTAVSLAFNSPAPQQLAHELRQKGFTHLMISWIDAATWFIPYHDPNQRHRKAYIYFQDVFLPACGKKIFENQGMQLFEITCH